MEVATTADQNSRDRALTKDLTLDLLAHSERFRKLFFEFFEQRMVIPYLEAHPLEFELFCSLIKERQILDKRDVARKLSLIDLLREFSAPSCLVNLETEVVPALSSFQFYVINLPHRSDRLSHVLEQLVKLEVPREQITIVPGIITSEKKGFTGSSRKGLKVAQRECGCALAHISSWQKSIEQNKKWALFLEDDCLFGENFATRFRELWDDLKTAKESFNSIVYSCTQTFQTKKSYIKNEDVLSTLECYFLSLEARIRLINNSTPILESGVAIDQFLTRAFPETRKLCVKSTKQLVTQARCFSSDISD